MAVADARAGQPEAVPHTADYGIVTALRDELLAVLRSLGAVEQVPWIGQDARYYHLAVDRGRVGPVLAITRLESG